MGFLAPSIPHLVTYFKHFIMLLHLHLGQDQVIKLVMALLHQLSLVLQKPILEEFTTV
jgi:hypothetical protein